MKESEKLALQAEENRKTELVNESYELISKIYNTDRGKNFILHLIKAFLPIATTYHNQLLSTNVRCSITNKLGFDFDTYTNMTVDTIFLKAKIEISDNEIVKAKAQKEYNDIMQKVKNHWKLCDNECMFDRKLVYSDKSDKLITIYSLLALQAFAIDNNLLGAPKPKAQKPTISLNERLKEKKPDSTTYTLGEKFGDLLKKND